MNIIENNTNFQRRNWLSVCTILSSSTTTGEHHSSLCSIIIIMRPWDKLIENKRMKLKGTKVCLFIDCWRKSSLLYALEYEVMCFYFENLSTPSVVFDNALSASLQLCTRRIYSEFMSMAIRQMICNMGV